MSRIYYGECSMCKYIEVKQYDMKGKKIPKDKQWDSEILKHGGISYWYVKDLDKVRSGEMKERYRVAMKSGDCDKMLKWKIKTASDCMFSVASKGQREAQLVVDQIFGKGMYRVSQFLVG